MKSEYCREKLYNDGVKKVLDPIGLKTPCTGLHNVLFLIAFTLNTRSTVRETKAIRNTTWCKLHQVSNGLRAMEMLTQVKQSLGGISL